MARSWGSRVLIKKESKSDEALDDLHANIGEAFDDLQTDMEEAFEKSLRTDNPPLLVDDRSHEEVAVARRDHSRPDEEPAGAALRTMGEAAPDPPRAIQHMTSHARGQLAALSSFDQLYQDAQGHLQEVEAKLMELRTSHHLTRELFNILHSDIHRANELELANSSLAAEQARLSERLRDANGKRQKAESLAAALQEREASHAHDKGSLRNALAAAKLEAIEAANTITRNEAELGDLIEKSNGQNDRV